jgi:hypothetical protein
MRAASTGATPRKRPSSGLSATFSHRVATGEGKNRSYFHTAALVDEDEMI